MPKNTFFEYDYEDFPGEKLDKEQLNNDEELKDIEKVFRHTHIPNPDFQFLITF